MGKMTIAEAAQHFNVSKEAIHNRIRRGSIDCVIEHGVKYVVVGESGQEAREHESRYYEYIEQENERLKAKVEKLENETAHLRDQRERMLIEERDKIEQIYKERDEQLRSVLNVVATKFLANMNVDHVIDEVVHAEEAEVTEIVETVCEEEEEELVALKDFLKLKGYKSKARDKIKARIKKVAGRDERIVVKEGKLFLQPHRYDYADLLK